MALKKLKQQPALSGAGRAWFGIVIGSLGLIVSVLGIATLLYEQANRR